MSIALRHTMAQRASGVRFSMKHTGSSPEGFLIRDIGTISLPCTFLGWYRFSDFPPYGYPPSPTDFDGSRMVFKAGNITTGAGFGLCRWGSTENTDRGLLIEGKYWNCYSTFEGTVPYDTSWHHLAVILKSGTIPTKNACFIDGMVQTTVFHGGGNSAMNTPISEFSICGRMGDFNLTTVQVCRVAVVAGELSASEIVADMESGSMPPVDMPIIHYWDGSFEGDKVKDLVGTWNLTVYDGCSISSETPWS